MECCFFSFYLLECFGSFGMFIYFLCFSLCFPECSLLFLYFVILCFGMFFFLSVVVFGVLICIIVFSDVFGVSQDGLGIFLFRYFL